MSLKNTCRRYISPSNRYWRNSTDHYDGRDRMDYGRYTGREGGRMRFRYPARELPPCKIKKTCFMCALVCIAPMAFPPYYPPPIPFYEGAPFPTGMYLNPYGGGPLYYPHPILPVDDNKLQGYVKKQM